MKVSICCLVALFALVHASPHLRIVGGQDAVTGQFPYQVAITVRDQHVCGGSIINQNWILTSAYCVDYSSPSDFTILAGSVSETSGGSKYSISSIIAHEEWDPNTNYADIALLRTSSPIQYTENVQPIALATQNPPPGKQATLSGWGWKKFRNVIQTDILQHIELNVIGLEECKYKMGQIFDNQVCTENVKGQGTCVGDSGGPLVYSEQQVGVVSWGRLCATGDPEVFTSVAAFHDWIDANIQN